jgi:hypothetical protein
MRQLLHAASIASLLSIIACGSDHETTVTVNVADSPIASVSPDMMGVHTAVYDGLLTTSSTTPMLLKDAGVTSLRYPGGSYADLYHWESNTGTATPAAGAGSNVIYVATTANFGSFALLLERMGAHALITVNYGMDPAGTGPGVPQEAAAWVAYANSMPTDTTVIGLDASSPPRDWMTAGYWAGLRASLPIATDDGMNFLRINHPAPIGIKYWEVGNELYGNGFYHGSATFAGWEADMHAPYNGTDGTMRRDNPALAPVMYGKGVKAFSEAMKHVDPTVQIGGIVHWPDTEYGDWNAAVLPEMCASMDFAVNHWYAGEDALSSLLTIAQTDIPGMYASLHTTFSAPQNNCGTKGATMPIAVTEWGPNAFRTEIGPALAPPVGTAPTHTQIGGIFAAESYANFMEQGALAVHWAQLHDPSYFGTGSSDVPAWGYHGALIAHHLASSGDSILPKPLVATSGGTPPTFLHAYASRHADGSLAVMLTNTGAKPANLTLKVTGGALAATGTRFAYTPMPNTDLDGAVTSEMISSSGSGTSVPVSLPGYSIVVVAFPSL